MRWLERWLKNLYKVRGRGKRSKIPPVNNNGLPVKNFRSIQLAIHGI
jgi:hypothetical protein